MREIKFFILALLEAWGIHFRSPLNTAYYKSNAFFKNFLLLYMKGGLPCPIYSIWHQTHSNPLQILSIHFLCHSYEYILFQHTWYDHETKRVMWENQKKQNRWIRIQLFCMHYFVKCTQWSWFYTASTENPLIDPFIHWGKTFRGKNVFLITRILVQSDPVINSSLRQRRKLLPVIYCATYLEPALLVDGFVCFFITHFLKNIRKNQKPWKSTWAKLIECHCQLNVKKTNYPTKIFYKIIVCKLRENRCNWFAFNS